MPILDESAGFIKNGNLGENHGRRGRFWLSLEPRLGTRGVLVGEVRDGVLRDYLPRHTYGVVGVYREGELVVAIAGVRINEDDGLLIQFPRDQILRPGDRVTVQLDNRMEVTHLSGEKLVYRTSYKGVVEAADEGSAQVRPVEFLLIYSERLVASFTAPGYAHPADDRPLRPLAPSPLAGVPAMSVGESPTPLGVLVTRSVDRPHTTVMAFLSSQKGDVFLITHPQMFKMRNLERDPRVAFAVDHRATYDLDKPLDWSYRVQNFTAKLIPRTSALGVGIQREFLAKSPWEGAFFAAPTSVLLHLEPN
jgi:hypothetical protein